jgi:hypothetical protein
MKTTNAHIGAGAPNRPGRAQLDISAGSREANE